MTIEQIVSVIRALPVPERLRIIALATHDVATDVAGGVAETILGTSSRPRMADEQTSLTPAIPTALRIQTEQRLRARWEKRDDSNTGRLDIRFLGSFCYVDVYSELGPEERPLPGSGESLDEYRERIRNAPLSLCRLQYCGGDQWSVALQKGSLKYEPGVFENGGLYGTPEEGLDMGVLNVNL